jgi:glycosyltransferase involved in cell wall biosynthesis
MMDDVKLIYNRPLVSVITVVFNGESFLEKTIQSVINQSYENIEYIIIDGGSSDGTLDIIRKYEQHIDYWSSEPDGGIYDAMNKGIDLANGEWLNFMNGGDEFYHQSSIAVMFADQEHLNAQIIFGNHQVIYPNDRVRIAKGGKVNNLWKGSQFCHQATFIKAEYHKTAKFNLSTHIAADFEFFYNAWKASVRFHHVDKVIAKYESGGVSDVKRVDAILEFWTIVDKSARVNLYFATKVMIETLKSFLK